MTIKVRLVGPRGKLFYEAGVVKFIKIFLSWQLLGIPLVKHLSVCGPKSFQLEYFINRVRLAFRICNCALMN